MRRALLLALGLGSVVLAGGAAMWTQVWGPEARAREVADVLAGRSYDADRLDTTPADDVRRLVMHVKDSAGLSDSVHDVQWGTRELLALAHSHPAALAHAAARERTPAVRFALLDAIEDKPAWASDVPLALQVEHVASHVVDRLDRPTGKPLTDAERAALLASRDEALESLRTRFVHGHCGALAGMKVLAFTPSPDEFAAALRAVGEAESDPASDLTPAAQAACRASLFDAGSPPLTEGGFHLQPPPEP